MKLTQKIAQDPKCKTDARAFSAKEPEELFQNSWLRAYNYEQRNPDKAKAIKNHRAFFYRLLHSEFIDGKRREKKTLLNIDDINETLIVDLNEEVRSYKDYLLDWIEEKTSDEMELFYKNIINLVIICGSVKSAVEMCPMGKTKFNHYLQEAKQKFKDDYNRTANLDHVSCVDVF